MKKMIIIMIFWYFLANTIWFSSWKNWLFLQNLHRGLITNTNANFGNSKHKIEQNIKKLKSELTIDLSTTQIASVRLSCRKKKELLCEYIYRLELSYTVTSSWLDDRKKERENWRCNWALVELLWATEEGFCPIWGCAANASSQPWTSTCGFTK